MSIQPPYKSAPVVEAVLGVRFVAPFTSREQERIRDRLKARLPAIEEQRQFDVNIGPGGAYSGPVTLTGYLLRSADAGSFALILEDNISSGCAAPYVGWQNLLEYAKTTWAAVRKVVDIRKVNRLGFRTINRIDIPENLMIDKNYRDFFNLSIADGNLPIKPIEHLFITFKAVHSDTGALMTVNFGRLNPMLLQHQSFNLDIDVSLEAEWLFKDEAIIDPFAILRKAKNDMFESIITDPLRELFS